MLHQFSRSELLLGAEGLQRLRGLHVAVFGIGGVGAYAAEALARSGIGALTLVDDDRICLTNLNRQLIALHSTVGQLKVEVMAQRIRDIQPDCVVTPQECFFDAETSKKFSFEDYHYVLDCVDTVSAKLLLIEGCRAANTPILSCMGTGNKLDPTQLEVGDIFQTRNCPLARVMRRELRKRGISELRVVHSTEPPMVPIEPLEQSCRTHCVCPPGTQRTCAIRRQIPGSVAFVPSVAGLIMAGEVVRLFSF